MRTKHFPVVTISIILLNGIIFAAGLLSGEQTHIIQKYGFIPDQFFNAHIVDNKKNNNDQQNWTHKWGERRQDRPLRVGL